MKRRHFLQFAGSTLAIGISHLDIVQQGNRYAKVLAQNTPRKLALLVGINDYPNSDRFTNLPGCVTDVDLHEKLLTYRFGFNKNDILRLTTNESADKQPTRSNILTAFEEHLIKQAKPGDVVVFHFSGHGSKVPEPDLIQQCRKSEFNSTFVPADSGQNGIAQDIMGRTLFLLMSALTTENVTVVLDSCHSGGGTRGNYIIRSVPGEGLKISPQEIAYQKSWMERLNISSEELAQKRCAGVAKGVVLASAKPEEDALDVDFGGFNAGAFTYLFTQYLWQTADNVKNAISYINSGIKEYTSNQHSLADGKQNQPIYFINKSAPSTDAVVIQSEGDKGTLWLGGADQESRDFSNGSTFIIIDEQLQSLGKVKLISPTQGLTVKAQLIEKTRITALKPGMLLQESIRVIPADLKLKIGLDSSLNTEINTAKTLLSNIKRIEPIPAQKGNRPYPTNIDYIFSRLTSAYQQKLQKLGLTNIPKVGSIGLFAAGLEPLSDTFGTSGESVQEAINRLSAKLKILLATRIIKTTLNANSSALNVEVAINLVDEPNNIIARAATAKSRNNRPSSAFYSSKLPLNKLFQLQVVNNESIPLYLTILLVDSSGSMIVVFPYQWTADQKSMMVESNQTLIVGKPEQLKLKALEKGSGEALIIISRKPLKKAVKTLVSLAEEQNRSEGVIEVKEPVEVIGDLLDDLKDERGIDVTQATPINNSDIAALSISFDVGL